MKSNVVFPRKPVVRLQKSIPVKTQNVAAANPKAFMGGGGEMVMGLAGRDGGMGVEGMGNLLLW
jgi:hypothetical protein